MECFTRKGILLWHGNMPCFCLPYWFVWTFLALWKWVVFGNWGNWRKLYLTKENKSSQKSLMAVVSELSGSHITRLGFSAWISRPLEPSVADLLNSKRYTPWFSNRPHPLPTLPYSCCYQSCTLTEICLSFVLHPWTNIFLKLLFDLSND